MEDTIFNLGLALALGLLVGTERGWQERSAPEGSRVAGIRTFGLIGLLGALLQLMAASVGENLLGFAFLAFVLLMVVAHVTEARVTKHYGVTTLVAALITFVLGALTMRGQRSVAAAGAVVTAVILSLKPMLHAWVQRIEPQELTAGLKLLLVSVVILPVLPNRDYGPWQALNPYELWWLVVLMAAISFAAYCAVRITGTEKGILLTGLLGGLVSSTSVSVHLARLAKAGQRPDTLAAGILVASATMFLRVLIVTAVINRDLLWALMVPLLPMAFILFAVAVSYVRKSESAGFQPLELRNPVELGQALQFAGVLATVFLLTKAVQGWLGETGVLLVAAVAGIADVDAITISLARMTGAESPVRAAVLGVLVATMVNTVTKSVLVAAFGGGKIATRVLWPMGACLLIGTLAAWYFVS